MMHALGTIATVGGVAARGGTMFVITAGTFASRRISRMSRVSKSGE